MRSVSTWLALVLATLVAMGVVGGLVHFSYPDDWRAVEARVRSTELRATRSGGLDWTVLAEVAYSVDGKPLTARAIKVFSDRDKAVAAAEQARWPEGRTLQVYYSRADARSVSRWPDGGRQAIVVTAVLMTLIAIVLAVFVAALVLQVRRRTRPARDPAQ